jgi:hypothetical protein
MNCEVSVMAQSKSLVKRLRVYGVHRVAEEVAHAHGVRVAQLALEGPGRAELVQRLVDAGWSSANVARVLDAGRDAGEAKKILADGGTHRSGQVAGRAGSASEGNERTAKAAQDPPGSPAAPSSARRVRAAAPAAKADAPVPRSAGVSGRAGGAPPREDAAPVTASDGKRHLAVVIPIHERPRMFEGPGVRHECVHEAECLGRALDVYDAREKVEQEARLAALAAKGRKVRRRSRAGLQEVHCPTWCKFLEPPSFEARLAPASVSSRDRFTS